MTELTHTPGQPEIDRKHARERARELLDALDPSLDHDVPPSRRLSDDIDLLASHLEQIFIAGRLSGLNDAIDQFREPQKRDAQGLTREDWIAPAAKPLNEIAPSEK